MKTIVLGDWGCRLAKEEGLLPGVQLGIDGFTLLPQEPAWLLRNTDEIMVSELSIEAVLRWFDHGFLPLS